MNDIEAASISLGIIGDEIRDLEEAIGDFTIELDQARRLLANASEHVVAAETRRDRLIAAGSTLAAAHGIAWTPHPAAEPDAETLASFEADARRQP